MTKLLKKKKNTIKNNKINKIINTTFEIIISLVTIETKVIVSKLNYFNYFGAVLLWSWWYRTNIRITFNTNNKNLQKLTVCAILGHDKNLTHIDNR